MIDTIKFKIKVSDEFVLRFVQSAISRVTYDHQQNMMLFSLHTTSKNFSSYEYNVNLTVVEFTNTLYVEYSIPKYVLGHNVHTVSLDLAIDSFYDLRSNIIKEFADVPDVSEWVVFRLDLCYAWKYYSDELAKQFLQALSYRKYKKYTPYKYETSFMLKGATLTHKFYLKKPEFFVHDYKIIKKSDEEKGDGLLNYADGVLRYEITLRKKALERLFEVEKLRVHHLSESLCIQLLKLYFDDIVREMSAENISDFSVIEKLRHKFSPKLVRSVYLYWSYIQRSTEQVQALLPTIFDRATAYRYDKYLRDLKIPKYATPDPKTYQFCIPSVYAVTHVARGSAPLRAAAVP